MDAKQNISSIRHFLKKRHWVSDVFAGMCLFRNVQNYTLLRHGITQIVISPKIAIFAPPTPLVDGGNNLCPRSRASSSHMFPASSKFFNACAHKPSTQSCTTYWQAPTPAQYRSSIRSPLRHIPAKTSLKSKNGTDYKQREHFQFNELCKTLLSQ